MMMYSVERSRPERADGQQVEVRVRPSPWPGAEQRGGAEVRDQVREHQESGRRRAQVGRQGTEQFVGQLL